MPVVTPGDILARCQALDGRIDAATQVIAQAPESHLNPSFRQAWEARRRRWESVRHQCSDWGSRWWNYRWDPVLSDWERNQAEWEAKVQALTGVIIPMGKPLSRPDDETLTNTVQQASRFPDVGKSMRAIAIALGVTVGGAVVLVAMRKR